MLLFWWGSRYSGSRQLAIFHIGFGYGSDIDDLQLLLDVLAVAASAGGRHSRLVTAHGEPAHCRAGAGAGPVLFRRAIVGATPTPACEQFLLPRPRPGHFTGRAAGDAGRLHCRRIRLSCLPPDHGGVRPCCWPGGRDLPDPLQHGSLWHHHAGVADQRDRRGLYSQGALPSRASSSNFLYRSPIIAVACATRRWPGGGG